MRESFVFYRSFAKACRRIKSKEERLALYDAIVDYALDDIEVDEDASELIAVLMETIKPQIDANNTRYENGKKGGRPKSETKKPVVSELKTSGFEIENHRFLTSEPNVNANANANSNLKGNADVPGSQANTEPSSLSLSLINYLNQKTGSSYRSSKVIEQKISKLLEMGYTENDMRMVIDRKFAEWYSDENMREYLRPSTLFGDKFEEYRNAPISLKAEKTKKKAEAKADTSKRIAEKEQSLEVINEELEKFRADPTLVRESPDEYRLLKEQSAILEDSIEKLKRQLSP